MTAGLKRTFIMVLKATDADGVTSAARLGVMVNFPNVPGVTVSAKRFIAERCRNDSRTAVSGRSYRRVLFAAASVAFIYYHRNKF